MTKHTPGPWHHVMDGFRITIGNKKTGRTTTPHNYMVAEIPDNSFIAEANARLIAAAPELLEALEDILSSGIGLSNRLDLKARAAIAKAKGEQ